MSQMNSENLFFDDTDNEAEVNSLVSGFLRDAALVIEASTPTIQKYQRNHIVRDRYGAHDSYDAVPDSLDEYSHIGDKTSRDYLMAFCNGVMELYGEEFLRRPTQTDVEKLYAFHEEKHGSHGSNDVKRIRYKQAHEAARKDVEQAFNVLKKKWAIPGSNDVKRIRYKQAHEAARKDVEQAFNVLKKKWAIKKKAISPKYYLEEQHREDDPVRSAQDMLRVIREIHDEETHLNLKANLVEHIWHETNAH
uniref:Uncharacterized protein n=1 Tax=Tanacetum cinerariifolium TaxID=118510 RepID=A0A6L2JH76_TANCI|nr:hypothetical protein [Tanacetum cinerariifolium]